MGVFYELALKNPTKKFYSVGHRQFCPNMKKISLEDILTVLEHPEHEIILPEEVMEKAGRPLARMLELAK